ncbi:hypothetical protein BN2497_12377 [Janthinobacterium sp. CG23_2]|nr:hypothetical protein BN2497_12377 [Janthinobacterium sp. CG23_2]CUU32586.1 hypothetical protein BN3177_12377 [Janthinobacterium sp. CG23_2]
MYRSWVTATPARPAFAAHTLALGAYAGEKVLALARDLPVHLKYKEALEAVIAGCLYATMPGRYPCDACSGAHR